MKKTINDAFKNLEIEMNQAGFNKAKSIFVYIREFGSKNADLFSDDFAHLQRMSPSGVENRKARQHGIEESLRQEKDFPIPNRDTQSSAQEEDSIAAIVQ